jgi:predicted phosphodiesterase
MPFRRNRPVTGLEAAERPPRSAFHPLCLVLRSLPHASVKSCTYLLVLTLFCLLYAVPALADTVYWAPWVTNTTTNSATINWRGGSDAKGSVEYATSSYYDEHHSFQETIASVTTGAYQHVPLVDLEPDTSYMYRVKPSDNPDVFSNRTFRTMPVSGPFTFIVLSDTHAQEKRFKYVADGIAKYETDVLFILDGGDYAGHDQEAEWTEYFHYADGMLAKFPLFHTIGNHEYHNHENPDGPPTHADQYHWTFDVPKKGALNYSFDCSGIRFVVLNSPDPNHANGDDPHTSLALAKSQAPWLKEQLDNAMAGTFTIHHHPIWDCFSSTINPNLGPWETLYHTYNISANFAGHTHNYQRYSVKGIPYFVVGNAGGAFADIPQGPHAKWYQYGETRQLGYLKVTVDPANNTATAQEIFVAFVVTDTAETATVYDPPIIADTVTFPLSPSTLTLTKSGLGSGTVASTPPYIHCGSSCQAHFKKSEKLVFTPTPDKGSIFTAWTGACKGHGRCSLIMNKDTTLGTVFKKGLCTYSVSPTARTLSYTGGQITVRITAKDYSYCREPEIKNDTNWITYTATPFVDNKGTVVLTIPEYDNPIGRSGTLTIGGKTFTVTQKGLR